MFLSWRAVKDGPAAWGGVSGSPFGGGDWAAQTSTYKKIIKWILTNFISQKKKKVITMTDFRSDVLQIRANVNTFFDDRQVLVKWKAIYGLVCQLH